MADIVALWRCAMTSCASSGLPWRAALALPDRTRYRGLLEDVAWALLRLDVTVYLVHDHGEVVEWTR